jgi:hypothetical protein
MFMTVGTVRDTEPSLLVLDGQGHRGARLARLE